MAKRRTKRYKRWFKKKEKDVIPTTFKCFYCDSPKSIKIQINKKRLTADVSCIYCGVRYQTHCKTISEQIDVYYDFLDHCERLNAEEEETANGENNEEDSMIE